MNNNGNRFFDGFLLGAMIGGAAVFLLGTRTGKNLLKILSEQGVEGLTDLLEEYDLADFEEVEEELPQEEHVASETNGQAKNPPSEKEESHPKKRFFRRIKR